ncbi:MAG TPA: Rrf2 family transcriptional regulator [Candidatus Limiplasma sp.]|nr:Rrf2 family transcriptional regulator [Candidatus Limiplasma sp.]HPS81283.1 Rrf2 family transcriptional regulator [Candidatus Limiplasma sp.]
MKISSRGRYALRFMIDLAQHGNGEAVTLKEVSKRQEISIKYLEQIVTLLNRGGLIRSVRGNQGGYLLTREAKDYTVGDILRIVEGDLFPVACMEEQPNQCTRYPICKTIKFWEGLYGVINRYVDSVTLEDLAAQPEEDNGWSYSI